jgi:uncharacterized protein (DUF302 family)
MKLSHKAIRILFADGLPSGAELMSVSLDTLGIRTTIQGDFEAARQRVIDALKVEGFGVLTEIDVKDTMKKKLDVDFRPYRILGACNPPFAHQALTLTPDAGLLLPCNVIVSQNDDGSVEVLIVDPQSLLGIFDDPALVPLASAVREKLVRVAESL